MLEEVENGSTEGKAENSIFKKNKRYICIWGAGLY